MKIAFFLALLYSATAAVTIIDSSCVDSTCQDYLRLYVKRFNSKAGCSKDGNMFRTVVSHNPPTPGCAGLYANAYTMVSSKKIVITDFKKTTDSSKFYLNMGLTLDDINNDAKCVKSVAGLDYITRECTIVIDYSNAVQNMVVKTYEYKMTIRIPRTAGFDFVVIGNPLFERGCDCKLDASLTFTSKMYRGSDCKNEISAGASLAYGDEICIAIFGADDLSRSSEYELSHLSATYSRAGTTDQTIDMVPVTEAKCSLDLNCVKGQIFLIVPIINIGRLNFAVIITLRDLKRVLATGDDEEGKPKGAVIDVPGEFVVTDPKGKYECAQSDKFEECSAKFADESTDDSGSSSIVVALTTLLALLTLIL